MNKKFLPVFLSVLLLVSLPVFAAIDQNAPDTLLKDVPSSHPAYSSVLRVASSYEAISGYSDGSFKGEKNISRAELSKIMVSAFGYLEQKYGFPMADEPANPDVEFNDLEISNWAYPFVSRAVTEYQIFSGYPDGAFKPADTVSRFELAAILAKVRKMISDRCGLGLAGGSGEVALKDVKPDNPAMEDIQLVLSLNMMSAIKERKKLAFHGEKGATRYDAAVSSAKLFDECDSAIAALSSDQLAALREKYGMPAPLVERSVAIPSSPEAFITLGLGNNYEYNSGTNNWVGLSAAATYANVFNLLGKLSGNYEITGKYGLNQIIYFIPSSGGGVPTGSVQNESRYELELNSIYPLVEYYGISGKLLLGLKYIMLNSSAAPTNFAGFNVGLVTSTRIMERKVLLRVFYSLPLARAGITPSVFGQPSQLIDYEGSIDAKIFNTPILLGLGGEAMIMSNGGVRYFNMLFGRYFLNL